MLLILTSILSSPAREPIDYDDENQYSVDGGDEYMIKVKQVQRSKTMLLKRPMGPIQNGPWGMLLRPRMSRQVTGME
ncbi:MAG: hypothetical protein L6R38_003255 [Xanthoria sp. 2 TBL-2021]|nr:MAG: hypothetical protein L6R38_003255 [Xanthoria sp. 2 TBL-2021]